MSADGLELTAHLGERDRTVGGFRADALAEVFARHGLLAGLILRGVEGFGAHHRLHTDRLLTLSEDLPVVALAADRAERIRAALAEVAATGPLGLLTLQPVWLPGAGSAPPAPGGDARLTVHLGRQERVAGRPAQEAVVALLHRRGIAGATVLLGVDGTAHGERRRAHFFARNADVPVAVVAVGDGGALATAVPELEALLARPRLTIARVEVLKRDGVRLAEPRDLAAGGGARVKLTVYAGEQSRHAGRPLVHELIRALRAAGAAGATSVRGVWGYHGDHAPHGDSLWQLRRRVPVVTTVVDAPERAREWLALVDALTDETGLVTCEAVEAVR